MSAIQVDEEEDGASAVAVQFSLTEDAARTVLLAVDLAGTLTVSDALTEEEISTLLATIEQENPAVVTSLEQFFSLPLLRYARDPQVAQDKVTKSFSAPGTGKLFRSILHESRLPLVQQVFGGGLGAALEREHLWPLQFLSVRTASIAQLQGGNVHLDLVLNAPKREEKE